MRQTAYEFWQMYLTNDKEERKEFDRLHPGEGQEGYYEICQDGFQLMCQLNTCGLYQIKPYADQLADLLHEFGWRAIHYETVHEFPDENTRFKSPRSYWDRDTDTIIKAAVRNSQWAANEAYNAAVHIFRCSIEEEIDPTVPWPDLEDCYYGINCFCIRDLSAGEWWAELKWQAHELNLFDQKGIGVVAQQAELKQQAREIHKIIPFWPKSRAAEAARQKELQRQETRDIRDIIREWPGD
jgi:hypothetical protein